MQRIIIKRVTSFDADISEQLNSIGGGAAPPLTAADQAGGEHRGPSAALRLRLQDQLREAVERYGNARTPRRKAITRASVNTLCSQLTALHPLGMVPGFEVRP